MAVTIPPADFTSLSIASIELPVLITSSTIANILPFEFEIDYWGAQESPNDFTTILTIQVGR